MMAGKTQPHAEKASRLGAALKRDRGPGLGVNLARMPSSVSLL